MNKQTIITILFTLVAVAGQAQVKSSLDLCLRDEVTGEWLIGLFDDYAVFDCEIWEYAKADTLKGEYMLRRGKEALKVKFLDKPSGKAERKDGCMRIGKKNYTVSKLTERTLPDYTTKDESDFIDNGYVGGKVTLRGRIVNVPKGHEDRVTIRIPDPLQTIFDNELPIEPDSLGRFELDIELANTGVVRMLWAKLILTPGETYFISMDGQTTGEQTRCFCHVADTVRALRLLPDCEASFGQILDIGSTHSITIRQLAETVIAQLHSTSKIEVVSYDEAYEAGFEDMLHRAPDCAKIGRICGWKAELPLDRIISDVAEQIRGN